MPPYHDCELCWILIFQILQTKTHICLITDYCPGGELFLLLDRQPRKVLKEDAVRYFYLHCRVKTYLFQSKLLEDNKLTISPCLIVILLLKRVLQM